MARPARVESVSAYVASAAWCPAKMHSSTPSVFMWMNSASYPCPTRSPTPSCPIAAENNYTPNGARNSGHESTFLRLSADWDVADRTLVKATFFYSDENQGHE